MDPLGFEPRAFRMRSERYHYTMSPVRACLEDGDVRAVAVAFVRFPAAIFPARLLRAGEGGADKFHGETCGE